jgi:hypothetical protein
LGRLDGGDFEGGGLVGGEEEEYGGEDGSHAVYDERDRRGVENPGSISLTKGAAQLLNCSTSVILA